MIQTLGPGHASCQLSGPKKLQALSTAGRFVAISRLRTAPPAPLPVSEESLMPKTTLRFLSAAFVMLLSVAPLWAQSTATLQGTVTDAQGAIVPGASVTATNEATGVPRSVITDNAGHYQMAALPAGSYRL